MSGLKIFRNDEERAGLLLILPAFLIIVGLIGYPFVYSIFLSFTNTTIGKLGDFVGFKNFIALAKSSRYQDVLIRSVIYTIGSLIPKLFFGLGVALLLRNLGNYKWTKFLKSLFLFPWVIPTSLSALAWLWLYNPNFSVLNWIIAKIIPGSTGIGWVLSPAMAMVSVIVFNVWRGVPFFAISFLAGLLSIDEELYEAADVEGANGLQKFLHISLPLLKPVVSIVLLFSMLMTIAEFNSIYIITNGGPQSSTQIIAFYSYVEGIRGGSLSRGAAVSIFLFPILFIVSYFQLRTIRKGIGRK